jgi:nucleoside-diphosphate-sugar epimerase
VEIRTEWFGCHHRPASHNRGPRSAWNLSDPLRVDLPRENIPVLDDGKNTYQFVHADDLAEACAQATMLKGADGFNRGTDRFGTMRAVLEHLCPPRGHRVEHKVFADVTHGDRDESLLRSGNLTVRSLSRVDVRTILLFGIRKARTKLGWSPRYSNNEMFVESYEWYLANRTAVLAGTGGASHHRSAAEQGVLKLLHWFF